MLIAIKELLSIHIYVPITELNLIFTQFFFQLFKNLFNPERTGKKKTSAENKDDNNDEKCAPCTKVNH